MIRTVIADDAADLRMLVRIHLDIDARFEVVAEAADGVAAIEQVNAHDPDLLLLDLAMPRMDGLEVLAALQERERPPVVVLSGFSNASMIEKAMALGAAAYLEKGCDLHTLGDVLATAAQDLRRRRG